MYVFIYVLRPVIALRLSFVRYIVRSLVMSFFLSSVRSFVF